MTWKAFNSRLIPDAKNSVRINAQDSLSINFRSTARKISASRSLHAAACIILWRQKCNYCPTVVFMMFWSRTRHKLDRYTYNGVKHRDGIIKRPDSLKCVTSRNGRNEPRLFSSCIEHRVANECKKLFLINAHFLYAHVS